MDKHQITTIIVTAAITVVVTVSLTELIHRMFSLTRKAIEREEAKQAAKRVFNAPNLVVFAMWLTVIWLAVTLLSDIRSAAPLTRLEVAKIAFWMILTAFDIIATLTLMGALIDLRHIAAKTIKNPVSAQRREPQSPS